MLSRIAAGLVCLVGAVVGTALCSTSASAQAALGTVSTPQLLTSCPTLPKGSGFDISMTCFSANISNCPNTDQIGIIYGVSTPTGQLNGTIVMLSGDGGVYLPNSFEEYIPASVSVAGYQTYSGYLAPQAPYQVIEAVWGAISGTPPTFTGQDWEFTNTALGDNALSILNAACRPATFLNWVRNGNSQATLGKGIWAGGITGQSGAKGMCVHGNSGGAAQAAYTLAWYGAGVGGAPAWGSGYLDKVVLENGPVYSDIEQGCEVTGGVNNQYTTICNNNPPLGENNSWEPGCTSSTWPQGSSGTNYHIEYIDGDQSDVQEWTQYSSDMSNPLCSSGRGTTTPSQNSSWYNMSIVNFPAIGQQPSFSYPNTAMSGWLCQNVSNTPPPQNNSAPQGQLFFYQFQDPSQLLSVNAVSNCPSIENIEGGTVSYTGTSYGPGNTHPSPDAIVIDMTQGNSASPSCATMGQKRAQQ